MQKKSFLKNSSGQGLIEYLILVAIMAIATMGVIKVVGQNVSAQFGNIANKIHGGDAAGERRETQTVSANQTRKRDMANFMDEEIKGK